MPTPPLAPLPALAVATRTAHLIPAPGIRLGDIVIQMFGGPRVVWDYSTYCCYILRVSVCIYVNRNDCVAVEDVLLVLNVRTLLVLSLIRN